MLIFDAHLDLAMNALEWNRDLRKPLDEIRAREKGMTDKVDREKGTVSFPEMRRGGVGLCVATQIARYVKTSNRLPGWHSAEQAWAQTQGQFAWYQAMIEEGELTHITDLPALHRHLETWERAASAKTPIGFILSLEGADSIVTIGHLERAYARGLRAVGPAHYGPGTYAHGTDATGGIGIRGRELLKEMDRLGIILDATHLCDESFWEAMDCFQGPVWASHSNARSLVEHHRQFSDEQIKYLIQRGAVIGGALDAWMMVPNWIRGKTTPEEARVTLATLVEHIDHVCQLAGNARHSALGTDLDGGFGREQSPADLESIADLQRFTDLFKTRGYGVEDIAQILHGNLIRFLENAWAKTSVTGG